MGGSLDVVAFVTRFGNRVTTLLALVSGPFTRPELQEQTGIPPGDAQPDPRRLLAAAAGDEEWSPVPDHIAR